MNRGLWNASLILIILGLVSLGAGLAAGYYERKRRNYKGRSVGRVADLIMREGDGPYRNKYYPVVEYYAEGKLYKKTLEEGAYPGRWETGEKIPILYDPSDPMRAGEDTGNPFFRYLPAMLYAAGIIMLLAGIYTFIRFALRS